VEPIYFESPAAFRAWLEAHHETETEILVGFHRKATGRPSMTWSESVDQALCFGWIDGVRRTVDAERYTIRFTPRKSKSTWSNINIAKVAELTAQGLMAAAGLRAFEQRDAARSGIYSFERERPPELSPEYVARFQANPVAWEKFQAMPAGYRRTATHWVISAKREETRQKRLETLIVDSERGRRIAPLTRSADRQPE
jgi:uncharacterized protein YdeI (YjbR/CyaY-like superfamily)